MRVPVASLALACLLAAAARGQTTSLLSKAADGTPANDYSFYPAVSTDGRWVVFSTTADNLVPGDQLYTTDAFLIDRTTGTVTLVSADLAGNPAGDYSFATSVSDDGRYVAFESYASNVVAGDSNFSEDVFVRDVQLGITTLVSANASGGFANGYSTEPAISGDGRFVVFSSQATDLVAGDKGFDTDIFVRDLAAGTTACASINVNGKLGNGSSMDPAISADGEIVAYQSNASNLVAGDTNGLADVFVWHASTGAIELVSVDSAEAPADHISATASVSADGRFVAFSSWASNLSGSDGPWLDVFVRDLLLGTTELASVAADGGATDGDSGEPDVSDDGRFVVFESEATNLVDDGAGGPLAIYVRDGQRGLNRRVSVRTGGTPADRECEDPKISGDGGSVVFSSMATNLDGGIVWTIDAFVHDAPVQLAASWTNYGAGHPGTLGVPTMTASADPVLATTFDVTVSNSSGRLTLGLLLAGIAPAQIPTQVGGDILVVPLIALPFAMFGSGASFTTPVDYDPAFAGVAAYAQALELDDGADHGWSFTPGLELHFGF